MNPASKHAALALLAMSLAGCAAKKAQTAAPTPPQAQAPDVSAGKAGAMYPPPLTETPTQPAQTAPPPAPVEAKSEPAPQPPPPPANNKKSSSRKAKPTAAKPAVAPTGAAPAGGADAAASGQTPPATAPATTETTTDMAAAGEPGAASPIGELTTGDAANQTQKEKETSDLINNTENGLTGIKRTLSAQEQETASQIKAFLNKARQALSNADLDGAYILATKAKVLLDELNKT